VSSRVIRAPSGTGLWAVLELDSLMSVCWMRQSRRPAG
jgi:hypothetical protein